MKKVKVITEIELGPYDFQCKKCKKIHTRSMWSVAHSHEKQIFTCSCSNVINLKAMPFAQNLAR